MIIGIAQLSLARLQIEFHGKGNITGVPAAGDSNLQPSRVMQAALNHIGGAHRACGHALGRAKKPQRLIVIVHQKIERRASTLLRPQQPWTPTRQT